MTRPIITRRKTQDQIQSEREQAFASVDWELVERISCTHWQIRHKTCGHKKKYAIASLMSTGLKPKCPVCINKARVKALAKVGYTLGERIDSAKFNITHTDCGATFAYKVASVVAFGTKPKCVFCDAKNKYLSITTS